MLNILKNTINRVFASGVDSDASAFITATGLSGTTQKSAITTLVKDLKASGLWSKMKAVYPMVTDNYNLLSYTEDFSNAAWGKVSLSVSANTTTAPNGTNTADTITDVVANQAHSTYQSGNPIVTGSMIGSVYLKDNGRRYAVVSLATGASAQIRYSAVVDLQNGTITQNNSLNSPTNTSSSITNIGNGWYRISVKLDCTIVASNANYIIVATSNTGTPTVFGSVTLDPQYVGDGSSIFIWGAQLESASTASTYQPIATTPSAFMASQMKYNLKDARDLDAAFRLTWSGGWTYSATGATPNGTNAYADTKLAPNLIGQNSAHASFYSRTNNTGLTSQVELGLSGTSDFTISIRWDATLGNLSRLNNSYVIGTNGYLASSTSGMFTISRTTSSVTKKYQDSSLKETTNDISAAPSNLNIYISARNNSGTAGFFSSKQVAFSSIGDGLTDQDAFLLNQIVEKYQVALSRGVQAAQSFYYNSAYSNEANTYLYSTQITGTTQVSAINTLINGLKANNLWSKMKAVYPFVTDYRNILGFTEDFGDGSWTKGNSTVTTNSTTAPNGTLTADSLVENVANSTHLFSNTFAITTSADNYTLSVYAKKANRDWININIYNGSTSLFAWFNLNTGTIGTVQSGLTASIQDAGNGWYRCSITRLMSTSSNVYIAYNACPSDNTNTYLGNGLVAAYIWGAQLEIGTSASTYQPVLATNNYSTNVAAQMKFNLVNPQDSDAAFRLAFSGGWTYSTNGAITNLINSYADTKLNPGTVFGSGYAAFGVYWRNTFGVGQTNIIGSTDGSNRFDLGYDLGVTTPFVAVGNASSTTGTDSSSKGLVVATRQNATSNKLFRNNNLIINGTLSFSANPSFNFYLGGRNNGGAAQLFNNNQEYAFAFLSTFLSDAEVAILTQLVTDYQTTLSRQV